MILQRYQVFITCQNRTDRCQNRTDRFEYFPYTDKCTWQLVKRDASAQDRLIYDINASGKRALLTTRQPCLNILLHVV